MIPHVAELIHTAREFARLRIPYKSGGRTMSGVDCSGLPLLVAWIHGVPLQDIDHSYGNSVPPAELKRAFQCQMVEIPIAEARPGDWILMWFNRRSRDPQHAAMIVTLEDGSRGLVHAYEGSVCVCEVHLTPKWEKRIDSVFRYDPRMVRFD